MLCTRNWTDEELKVAQEWIRRDSRHLPLGKHCACPDFCYKRSYILGLYLCFSFFGLIIFIFGIYVGYVFVRPYRLSLSFENATCVTSETEFNNGSPWEQCSCGWWCKSEFPCLKVYVNVTPGASGDVKALLHDSEMYMDGPCTFEPTCMRSKEENRQMVEAYQEEVGEIGTHLLCLYDPFDHQRVITAQRSDPWWVLHILLWPNVVALAFFMLVFTVCLMFGHRYVCVTSPPDEIAREASHRRGSSLETIQHLEEGRPLKKNCENDCYSTISPEPC